MTAAAPPPDPDGMGQDPGRPEYTFDQPRAVGRDNPGALWPSGDADNRLWPECWPVIRPSFALSRDEPIFTIGSCFARNIERHLSAKGFDNAEMYHRLGRAAEAKAARARAGEAPASA